jgi:spore germination protein KB
MGEKTASAQKLKYSIGAFIISSSLLVKGAYSFTKNETYLAALLGLAGSLIIVWVYTVLHKMYPGRTLIEMNDAVFGPIAGKLFSACYILYFFTLAVFNTRDLTDFVNGFMLPATPMLMIQVLFIAVCAWAVKKGPVNILSYGTLFFILAAAVIVFISILLLNLVKLKNLLPVFALPVQNYLFSAHIFSMLPLCEIFAFLMFSPYMDDQKKFRRSLVFGLFIGGAALLFIVARDTAVLGNYTLIASAPTFFSVRLIDVGDILTRLEILYALAQIILLFFKVVILFYATASAAGRLLKFSSHQTLCFVLGALIVLYARDMFISTAEQIEWRMKAAATYSTFFIVLLPLATFITGLIRRALSRDRQSMQTNAKFPSEIQ